MIRSETITVLTGDLIDSSSLGSKNLGKAFKSLSESAKLQAEWHGAPLHLSRHRGDGWQVVLNRPELALRSALAFRAALRAEGDTFDSYIAAYEGKGEVDVNPTDLNTQTTPVFVNSGRMLDALKSGADMRTMRSSIAGVQMVHEGRSGATKAAFILADGFAREWTVPQALAMQYALVPKDRLSMTKIAQAIGHSRQAITKSLVAAGFKIIIPALLAIEDRDRADD